MNVDPIRCVAGTKVRLVAVFLDAAEDPVTGLSPTVQLKRSSDDKYLKPDDTWQTGVPSPLPTMTELDATNYAGRYYFEFTPPAKVFGIWYDALIDGGSTADNRYWDLVIVSAPPAGDLLWQKKIGGDDAGELTILDTDGATELAVLEPSQPDEETLKMTLQA